MLGITRRNEEDVSVARLNLQATIDRIDFAKPVWQWLDLCGDMVVATQNEGLAHESFVADDSFKRLMVFGTNRIIASLNSIYILLRCEYIDLATAQVRVLCEALIVLSYVAKEPKVNADLFWDYKTIEAFETARTMVELERSRAKPEHVTAMERWLEDRRPEYELLKPRYTYVVPYGKSKGKTRPYRNWCNRSVEEQAKECGDGLNRLYKLVYKQMSPYVHCSAFSLRRQAAYSGQHYDADVVQDDIAMLVRTTASVWIEVAKFLSDTLGWDLMAPAAALAQAIDRLEEENAARRREA